MSYPPQAPGGYGRQVPPLQSAYKHKVVDNSDFDTVSRSRLDDSQTEYSSNGKTVSGTPDPAYMAKQNKKTMKQRNSTNMINLLLLPFMLYAGSARFLLTYDNKRKYVKFA